MKIKNIWNHHPVKEGRVGPTTSSFELNSPESTKDILGFLTVEPVRNGAFCTSFTKVQQPVMTKAQGCCWKHPIFWDIHHKQPVLNPPPRKKRHKDAYPNKKDSPHRKWFNGQKQEGFFVKHEKSHKFVATSHDGSTTPAPDVPPPRNACVLYENHWFPLIRPAIKRNPYFWSFWAGAPLGAGWLVDYTPWSLTARPRK